MEKNVNNQRVTGFQAPDIVLLILSGIAAGVFSQIAGAGTDVTVRNTVSALLAASVMVFLLGSAYRAGSSLTTRIIRSAFASPIPHRSLPRCSSQGSIPRSGRIP